MCKLVVLRVKLTEIVPEISKLHDFNEASGADFNFLGGTARNIQYMQSNLKLAHFQ